MIDPGLIVTVIVTGISAAAAARAELNRRSAARDAKTAEAVAQRDNAREEYIKILEGKDQLLTATVADHITRIANLEAAEKICQEERNRLSAENSRLRRDNEDLRRRKVHRTTVTREDEESEL